MSDVLEPRLQAFCCPTCGHKSQARAVPLDDLRDYVTASLQRRVLDILIQTPKGVVIDELIQKIYGDAIDGGPLYAGSTISVTLVRLRNALAPLGWAITKGYGKGGRRPIQLVPHSFVNRDG